MFEGRVTSNCTAGTSPVAGTPLPVVAHTRPVSPIAPAASLGSYPAGQLSKHTPLYKSVEFWHTVQTELTLVWTQLRQLRGQKQLVVGAVVAEVVHSLAQVVNALQRRLEVSVAGCISYSNDAQGVTGAQTLSTVPLQGREM